MVLGQSYAGRPVDREKGRHILAAARELLFRQGPQAVTMEAVAALAGVSKATVYSRHANRVALIRAVIRQQAEQLVQHIALAPESLGDVRTDLTDFVIRLSEFLTSEDHTLLMRALGAAHPMGAALLQEIYLAGPQATLERLAGWLALADGAGLIACPEPLQSAETLLGMVTGLDLVRAMYGVPNMRGEAALAAHAERVVEAFLMLHARPDSGEV
jgi:TetR/AcrR family transcriptional regulator, mexJK operon transcriptional repressor